ncbi:MAG: hypothetical protein EOO61_06355 [Hymenobacter sp.]|nr:MAG: hypothetical protein EOO61_06355 [Hymenobacter sp.]
MGKIESGISGSFSGKVGPVVGCTWKGVPYMRGLPKKRTSVATGAELANRKRFADMHKWLKPLLSVLRIGFKGYSPRLEGFLAAKSYLLRYAIEGEYPNTTINPAKVKLSHGDLPLAENLNVAYQVTSEELVFSWDPSTPNNASSRDQVMMVAYFTGLGEAISVTSGAFRQTGTDKLQLSGNLLGHQAEVYIAFISEDRQKQSDSVYLGSILCE